CHARCVDRELHVTRRTSTADRRSETAASMPRDLMGSLRRYDTPLRPLRITSDDLAATALISTVEAAPGEPPEPFRTIRTLQKLVCVRLERKQTTLLVGSSRFFTKNFNATA